MQQDSGRCRMRCFLFPVAEFQSAARREEECGYDVDTARRGLRLGGGLDDERGERVGAGWGAVYTAAHDCVSELLFAVV